MDHKSLPGFFLCGKATVENFWTPLLLFGFQMSCSLYPNILRILLKVPIESFCTPTFQGPVLLLLRPSFCTPTFQGPVLLLPRPSLCTPTFLPPRKHPRLSPSCCTPPPSSLFLPPPTSFPSSFPFLILSSPFLYSSLFSQSAHSV